MPPGRPPNPPAPTASPAVPDPAVEEQALSDEQARALKRQRRQEEDARRPLESWERYRALVDAFEHATDLVDLNDHKARFALVILGVFNAALYLAARELVGSGTGPFQGWLFALLVGYGVLGVLTLLMAIEALRPRARHPRLARAGARPAEDEPAGLRSFHDALERDRDDYREAWRELRVSQLNAELAVQVHELARINRAKDAALRWLYRSLQLMTLLGALGLGAAGLQGVVETPAHPAAQALPARPEAVAPGAVKEASGVAYHAGRGTLFVVGDRGHLVELDLSGRVLRDDALGGDLEDVAVHDPSGLLVLVSEKTAELLVFDPAAARITARVRLDRRALLGERPGGRNRGFEGLAFQADPARPGGGLFHLVHQDQPALVVTVAFDPARPPVELGSEALVARSVLPGEAGLSAAAWLAPPGRLLVVARRGPRLLLAHDGVVERAFALPTPQPEGVALDAAGDLWVADDRAGLLRVRGFRSVLGPGGAGAGGGEGWQRGRGLSMEKGKEVRLALVGYGQLDLRAFGDWGPEEVKRAEEFELRRLRLGLEADVHRLHVEAEFDPADEGEHLKDLYGELRFGKALRVRAGHTKLPVSPEVLTSASRIDFPERTMLAEKLGPSRDWGLLLHGQPRRWLAYQAGLFAGDGTGQASRSGATLAARLVATPLRGLDVGASLSHGQLEADPVGPDARPHGLEGQTPSGFEFSGRHFVDGGRLRLGADAGLRRGPLGLRAEWLRAREDRDGQGALLDDVPAVVGQGWAASATVLLTGERKKGTIEPRRPLFRGPGAVELGLRYESLRFDDEGPDTGFAGLGNRSRNIRPVEARALSAGVCWWPHLLLRVQGDVVAESYPDPLVAPEPGRNGPYLTFAGRLQVRLP